MRHNRDEVIARATREFELLDALTANLSEVDWQRRVPRPETKDPWTVKDALAHNLHWQADTARKIRGERVPVEERGLNYDDGNRLVYLRWRDKSPAEVLAWQRLVREEVLAALRTAPDAYFEGREHAPQWPYDLDGHAAYHRTRDIAAALGKKES